MLMVKCNLVAFRLTPDACETQLWKIVTLHTLPYTLLFIYLQVHSAARPLQLITALVRLVYHRNYILKRSRGTLGVVVSRRSSSSLHGAEYLKAGEEE